MSDKKRPTTYKRHMSKELSNGIKILGDAWVLCIVCTLAKNSLRFNEIQRAVNRINPTTLANRLKKLEAEKVVTRQEETVDKLSVVYSLTDKGREILPILEKIELFAGKFLK